VHLVQAPHATDFIEGLKTGYAGRTGRQAQVYHCRASGGAAIESWGESGSG
jgi:galactokinase